MWGKAKICKNLPSFIPLPTYDEDRWERISQLLFGDNPPNNLESLIRCLQEISGKTNLDFESLGPGIKCFGEDLFFREVLPFIISMVKETPRVFEVSRRLPFLRQFENGVIELTKREVCVLMCNAFFSTFNFYQDRGDHDHHWSKCFNEINFWSLFNFEADVKPIQEKIKMFIHYFYRCSKKIGDGKIIIERRFEDRKKHNKVSILFKNNNLTRFSPVIFHPQTSIYDKSEHRQVDFANILIGGGALNCGLAQEEIFFSTKPECCVSMLFCPCMTDSEVILIRGGVEQFCVNEGYGWSLKFGKDYEDPNIGKFDVLAMDALSYFAMESKDVQWERNWILRDVWKSYLGFKDKNKMKIATGHWGCGAFGGNKRLKFIQQWISASVCEKELHYHTFEKKGRGNDGMAKEFGEFVEFVRCGGYFVGQVYGFLGMIGDICKKNDWELSKIDALKFMRLLLKNEHVKDIKQVILESEKMIKDDEPEDEGEV